MVAAVNDDVLGYGLARRTRWPTDGARRHGRYDPRAGLDATHDGRPGRPGPQRRGTSDVPRRSPWRTAHGRFCFPPRAVGRYPAARMSPHDVSEVLAWLRHFASAVRDRDEERACELFDATVLGFGTVADRADGLDALRVEQWRHIWPLTSGFDFDYQSARIDEADAQAWVAAGWTSTGYDRGGAPFARTGRATIVLRRSAGGWRAVHTHFSLCPSAAARTPARLASRR